MSDVQSPSFNGLLPPSDNTNLHYNFNTNVMLATIAIFIVVILLIILLHVYARWCWLHPYGSIIIRGAELASAPSAAPPAHHTGLHPAAIAQLPTFLYKVQPAAPPPAAFHADGLEASASKGSTDPLLECVVCLGEFQDNQKVRLLPSCKHIFHMECIDMWLSSHCTCPLCRTPAFSTSPPSNEQRQREELQVLTEAPRSATEGSHGGVNSSSVQLPSNMLFWSTTEGQLAASTEDQSSAPHSAAPSRRIIVALPRITIEIPAVQGSGAVVLARRNSGRRLQRSTCCHAEQAAAASSMQAVRSPGSLGASLQRMLSRQSSRHQSNNDVEGGGGEGDQSRAQSLSK